jgi:hypothetical protein
LTKSLKYKVCKPRNTNSEKSQYKKKKNEIKGAEQRRLRQNSRYQRQLVNDGDKMVIETRRQSYVSGGGRE